MKPYMRTIVVLVAVVAVMGLYATPSYACATCFGAEDSPQTHAMNAAIVTMLGVTYGLFMGMAGIVFYLWRRSLGKTSTSLMEDIEEENVVHG